MPWGHFKSFELRIWFVLPSDFRKDYYYYYYYCYERLTCLAVFLLSKAQLLQQLGVGARDQLVCLKAEVQFLNNYKHIEINRVVFKTLKTNRRLRFIFLFKIEAFLFYSTTRQIFFTLFGAHYPYSTFTYG